MNISGSSKSWIKPRVTYKRAIRRRSNRQGNRRSRETARAAGGLKSDGLTLSVRTPIFRAVLNPLTRRLLVIAICVSGLIRAASVSHAHDSGPFHAHQALVAPALLQHCLVPSFGAGFPYVRSNSIGASDDASERAIHCSVPVPHDGIAVFETVIGDASGRTVLSKLKLAQNPSDGILLSPSSLEGCKGTAAIPQRHAIGRDEASSLNFILRTNHAFLA